MLLNDHECRGMHYQSIETDEQFIENQRKNFKMENVTDVQKDIIESALRDEDFLVDLLNLTIANEEKKHAVIE
jgi:hypothetical protein